MYVYIYIYIYIYIYNIYIYICHKRYCEFCEDLKQELFMMDCFKTLNR